VWDEWGAQTFTILALEGAQPSTGIGEARLGLLRALQDGGGEGVRAVQTLLGSEQGSTQDRVSQPEASANAFMQALVFPGRQARLRFGTAFEERLGYFKFRLPPFLPSFCAGS